MTLGQLKASLGFDTSGLKAAGQVITKFIGDTKNQLRGLEKFFDSQGKALVGIGKRISIALTAPLVALGLFASRQAAENETVARRFEASWGAAAASTRAELAKLFQIIPVGNTELELMVSRVKALVQALDVAPKRAGDMAIGLLKMAGALAKVKGFDVTEVLDAMRSGLAGMTRGLREFDIAITDSAIEQEAFRSGILGVNQELTAAGRAQVVYNLLQKQTADVQRQAATATETSAQKFQRFRRDLTEAAETLGAKLLPSLTALIQKATAVLQVITQLDPALLNTVLVLAAIAAAAGPVLIGIGSMIQVVGQLTGAVRVLLSAAAMGGMASVLGVVGIALVAIATGALVLFGKRLAEDVKHAQDLNREMLRLDTTLSTLSQNPGNIPFMNQWIEDTDAALKNLAEMKKALDNLPAPKGLFGDTFDKGPLALSSKAFNIPLAQVRELLQSLELGPNSTFNQVIQKIEAETRALQERRSKLVQAINIARGAGATGGLAGGVDSGALVTSTKTEIESLEDSVRSMAATFEQIPAALQQQDQFWLRISELQGSVTALLASQSDQYGETAVRARALLQVVRDIARETPLRMVAANQAQTLQDIANRLARQIGVTPGGPAAVRVDPLEQRLRILQDMTRRFTQLQNELVRESVAGSSTGVQAAQRDLEDLRNIARAAAADMATFLGSAGLTSDQVAAGVAGITDAFRAMGIAIEGLEQPASELERILEAISQVASAAANQISSGFANAGNAIGSIVNQVAGFIGNIGNLGAALKKIRAERAAATAKGGSTLGSLASIGSFATAAVGIAGAVGSLVSALGAHARELRAIMRSNADSIAAATLGLSDDLNNPETISAIQRALRSSGVQEAARQSQALKIDPFLKAGPLNIELQKLGFTFAQINAIANAQGIKLLDSNGKVVAGAFEQLAIRLGITQKELAKLGSTADSITDSLTNIPAWYRMQVNQRRFQAVAPGSTQTQTTGQGGGNVYPGAIVINVSREDFKNADKLAQIVIAKMKGTARRQQGNPTKTGSIVG